jgi:hypothetical protein
MEPSEVDAMLLELADHDGDVDRAVERTEDAVAWVDRAVSPLDESPAMVVATNIG